MTNHNNLEPLDIVDGRTPAQRIADGDGLFPDVLASGMAVTYVIEYYDHDGVGQESAHSDFDGLVQGIRQLIPHEFPYCWIHIWHKSARNKSDQIGHGHYIRAERGDGNLLYISGGEEHLARGLCLAVNKRYAEMETA